MTYHDCHGSGKGGRGGGNFYVGHCTVNCGVYFTVNDVINGLVRILANLEPNRVCHQSQNFHSKKPVQKIIIFFNSLTSRITF